MRPIPGDGAFGRPRTAENDTASAAHQPPAPQMTYTIGDESTVDLALLQSSVMFQRSWEQRKDAGHDSAAASDGPPRYHHSPSDGDGAGRDNGPPSSKGPVDALGHGDDIAFGPGSPVDRHPGVTTLSRPVTPILLGPSGPASALSSTSSRRNSLVGSLDLDSQAVSTDGEADTPDRRDMVDSGPAPQLVMPSIKMPSRRPFTDTGKSMGRLKVLIAGDSGVGKTSLVKAIVQSCEHIVHVDPISPSPVSSVARVAAPPRRTRWDPSRSELGTTQITEIFASTKPYPEWWSDLDDSRILKRRKSLGDTVLDRNICFVDTPGYGSGSSAMDTISPVVQYVESHLQRMSSNTLADGDVLSMLGGDGGAQVDAVLYLISHRLKPVDLEYLRRLAPLTNVIPLLAQADLLSPEQIAASKEQIDGQLREANIQPLALTAASRGGAAAELRCPHAISSALGSDHDTMDASLLMSPDYVQPLLPTELVALVEQVFSQDGASWLRHSAARKYIQWRSAESTPMPMALYQPLAAAAGPAAFAPASHVLAPSFGATSSFAVARLADHARREERLAQIRLASWAADLQKSLERERAGYEQLARGERAVWLTERLNECVQDGTLVPVSAGSKAASPAGVDGKARRGWDRRARSFSPNPCSTATPSASSR